jgi:8-oxo-dGTP pyrophosphatase MutT (NUDIX family)
MGSKMGGMIDEATLSALHARLARALAPPALPLVPFVIDGHLVGALTADRAARLAGFAHIFRVGSDAVAMVPGLGDEPARSEALATVARTLAAEGALSAWRNERYAVAAAPGAPPWFLLERAAARYFGVHTSAAHVNGLVATADGTRMWLARRSPTKAIDPSQLDNLVGGGVAAGMSVAQTVVKESWEEAGIAPSLAGTAVPCGTVHIRRLQPDGLQSETIFVHDLWLAPSFVPANQDGEAVEHRGVSLPAAAALCANTDGPDVVTADASLVILDCLLRQGAIDARSPSHRALLALTGRAAAGATPPR